MSTIDTSQDGETVRAEVIGRKLAYDSLEKFVRTAGIIREPLQNKTNIFK